MGLEKSFTHDSRPDKSATYHLWDRFAPHAWWVADSHIPFASLLSRCAPQIVIWTGYAGRLIIRKGFSNPTGLYRQDYYNLARLLIILLCLLLFHNRMLIQKIQKWWIENPSLLTCVKTIQNSTYGVTLVCFYTCEISVYFSIHHFWSHWITTILHSKSIVDGPILHSKSVLDRSILHCKAKVCVFSKIYYGKIINIPYRNVYQRTWKLVDCKIYNSSTRGKSIQNQSTTPFGRCGLTFDWFTTREIVIDFAIHQLLGPLITPMFN